MASGVPYDSPEGRALCGALSAILTGVSYATSAEMARELGPFPGYEANREAMLRVMRNHARAAAGEASGYEGLDTAPVPLDHASCPDPRLLAHAMHAWEKAIELGRKHGYRNAQATVIAPTGTIGLVMDCDTRTQHLVRHQRHGSLRPLRRAVQGLLDDRRAGVGVDPDVYAPMGNR